jgi:molecular chaperone GrpE (heat shock protein)
VLAWLQRWLRRDAGDPHARLLALERSAQELRLTLRERDGQVAQLKADLERQRQAESARLAEGVAAERERLFAEAAGPVAQLLTQAHLLEAEGKPVQARDVLAVARRLVRALQDQGLELVAAAGEEVPFDPNRHAALGGPGPAPGQRVRVRFAGVAAGAKVLRKAGVEVVDARTTGG